MAGFWTDLPAGLVVSLSVVSVEEIHLALEPPPPGAPAGLTLRPAGIPRSWSAMVPDELDAYAGPCSQSACPASGQQLRLLVAQLPLPGRDQVHQLRTGTPARVHRVQHRGRPWPRGQVVQPPPAAA